MIDPDLIELTELPARPEDEFQPPAYGTPGRIIVEIEWGWDDINILDYDGDTSVFWINEGIGFDYFIETYLDLPGPGRYLIEGVVGTYIKGQDWLQSPEPYDDDEEWTVGRVSRTDLETLL